MGRNVVRAGEEPAALVGGFGASVGEEVGEEGKGQVEGKHWHDFRVDGEPGSRLQYSFGLSCRHGAL